MRLLFSHQPVDCQTLNRRPSETQDAYDNGDVEAPGGWGADGVHYHYPVGLRPHRSPPDLEWHEHKQAKHLIHAPISLFTIFCLIFEYEMSL